MTYSVTITKKHCEGRIFISCTNCPLAAAIKEQLPNFKLGYIGGSTLNDMDYNEYSFDSCNNTGWHLGRMEEIERGAINSHTVTFKHIVAPPTKIITKYVSVPESITKQLLNLS